MAVARHSNQQNHACQGMAPRSPYSINWDRALESVFLKASPVDSDVQPDLEPCDLEQKSSKTIVGEVAARSSHRDAWHLSISSLRLCPLMLTNTLPPLTHAHKIHTLYKYHSLH